MQARALYKGEDCFSAPINVVMLKYEHLGTSLVIQWFRLHAGGVGLIPGWGTNIPHAVKRGQKFLNKLKKFF